MNPPPGPRVIRRTSDRSIVAFGSREACLRIVSPGWAFVVGMPPASGIPAGVPEVREDSTHADYAGALCAPGSNGCCRGCGVDLEPCEACGGIGYHRPGCAEIG